MSRADIPEELKSQIIETFLNEGLAFSKLSEIFNIPAAKISKLIKDEGVVDPRKTILDKFETLDSDKDRGMLAAQVYKKFPEPEFWQRMVLPFKLNSLKWLLSEDGESFISQYISEFKRPAPIKEVIELSGQKIGEDYEIKKKKTRKDFIE